MGIKRDLIRVMVGVTELDYRKANFEEGKRLQLANKKFKIAKYLFKNHILTHEQFCIYCLREGLNSMRKQCSFSEISAIMKLNVEKVLGEYHKAYNLVTKNIDIINFDNKLAKNPCQNI